MGWGCSLGWINGVDRLKVGGEALCACQVAGDAAICGGALLGQFGDASGKQISDTDW